MAVAKVAAFHWTAAGAAGAATVVRSGSHTGTALLFAASHSNTMTFVPLVLLAFMLTWLYERTGNLLTSILAHSTFNLVNFVWLVAEPLMRGAAR